MTADFQVGHNLLHPEYGPCTVTFVGQDYVGVEFGEGGKDALLRKESFRGEVQDDSAVARSQGESSRESLPWPESGFAPEPPSAQHSLGAHWQPFFEDAKEILLKIPEIISKSSTWLCFGEIHAAPKPLPDHWVRGYALAWPAQRQGVIAAVSISSDGNQLMSLFPFFTDSGQHTINLRRIIVWRSGVEAQIEAAWGDSVVTFFDVGFLVNRLWYEAGRNYEFILSGIAYDARLAIAVELPFTRHPDDIAGEQVLAEKHGKKFPEPDARITLRGAAIFLPVKGYDEDEYSFRGAVKSVKEVVGNVLGQTGWIVRTTVMRFGEEDANLDILVTRRAWRGDEPPSVGQEIEGSLWLQGYLWDAET